MRARSMAARRRFLRRVHVPFVTVSGLWQVATGILGGEAWSLLAGLAMLSAAVLLHTLADRLAPGPTDRDGQRRAAPRAPRNAGGHEPVPVGRPTTGLLLGPVLQERESRSPGGSAGERRRHR